MALTAAPRTIDYTHFGEVEATYGDITATPAAGDAFRSRAKNLGFKSDVSRNDRDKDSDRSASVHLTTPGRRAASFEFPAALAPSGITATPTAPDLGESFRAHFGTQDVGTGHSTCTSGSTTTVIQGTAGAVAAMGAAAGRWLIATTTSGLEARIILSIATDAITVDRAYSSAPINTSPIYSVVGYRLSFATMLSMIYYGYANGDFEHLCAGSAVANMEISYDVGSKTPEPMVKFSGPAATVEVLATAIPTPTLQTNRGMGAVPMFGWLGATKFCLTKVKLNSNNGMELIESEACQTTGALLPSGIKRTGNDGRYKIDLELEALLVGATIEGHYDNARSLANLDVIVQINNQLGNGFAFRTPKFIPDAEESEVDSLVGIALKGRCYGNGTDDTELTCCFF